MNYLLAFALIINSVLVVAAALLGIQMAAHLRSIIESLTVAVHKLGLVVDELGKATWSTDVQVVENCGKIARLDVRVTALEAGHQK